MIANVISNTPITGGITDSVFNRIGGDSFRGDVSFVATMRMLLHGIIGDNERFYFYPRRLPYSLRELQREDISDWFARYGTSPDDMEDGTFQFLYSDVTKPEEKDEFIKTVSSKFIDLYDDWEMMQSVTDLFYSNCGVVFFVNREHKTICMFMDRISMKMYHFMQCAIPGMIPWYFERGKRLPPEKKNLIMAMKNADEAEYIRILQQFADQFDFRSEQIRSSLNGFESVYIRAQIESTGNDIENRNHIIEDLRRRLCEEIRRKESLISMKAGLEFRLGTGEIKNDIMDYFIANKSLYLDTVDGTEVRFSVKTYLDYFDPDKAQAAMNNPGSYMYTMRIGNISSADMMKLVKAVFIDQEVRLLMCAAYRLDINMDYRAISGFDYPQEFNECLRNPHIEHHSCLGGYETKISEALQNHNMVAAVDACVQSARSVNMNESASAKYLIRDLYYDELKCVELPDGRHVKPSEAIQWLKEREDPAAATDSTEEPAQEEV